MDAGLTVGNVRRLQSPSTAVSVRPVSYVRDGFPQFIK